MRIIRGLASFPPEGPASAVALGVFDGVHQGHRAILAVAVAQARASGHHALACTFDPHPLEILQPGRAPAPITTLPERLALIAETGMDSTVVVEFTPALAALEPEAFVAEVLVGRLKAGDVVVGYNHRFGQGARGDAALLIALGRRLGFRAHVVPALAIDGRAVSSSEVRTALQAGEVELAARLLGRPYTVAGRVVSGAGRGRTLGFPTANVTPERPVLVPPGVYACQASAEGVEALAVVNVGIRPTFGEGGLLVEAYLLDFASDLYGQRLTLAIRRRLRPERKFDSVDALRAQIARDVEAARGPDARV